MQRLRARDVMTYPVVTVRPETSVRQIARILTERGVSGVPVTDDRDHLLGIVTEGDLVLKEAGPGGLPLLAYLPHDDPREADARALLERVAGKVAADVMVTDVITTTEATPLRQVAGTMARNGVNRIPVVSGGQVVGIVTRADVLRCFVRPDSELRRAVGALLVEDLGLGDVRLDVVDGVVTLAGELPTGRDAGLISVLVGEVDGVVSVDASGLVSGALAG